jgi:serine protease Do
MTSEHPLNTASEALADAVERVAPSVVAVLGSRHDTTSGILWRPGVIVTVAHGLRGQDDVRIALPDGQRLEATLAGLDPGTDVAVLRADPPGIVVPELRVASGVRAGNFVFAVARAPNGRIGTSFGIVAAADGEWRTWRGGQIDRLLRLDGGLPPGFSGGPLADVQGGVIGIGTSALSRSAGILIPSATVNRVADALLAGGSVPRSYLGIGTQAVELPSSMRDKLGLQEERGGLIVLSLTPQGPADQAGLLVGDIILELNGRATHDVRDLQAALAAASIGSEVRASLLRGGTRAESTIVLAERPRRGC